MLKKLRHWFWTGETEPVPTDKVICQQTRKIVPPDWRYCEMCDQHIPPGVRCDYDWGGQCSAGKFNWLTDNPPPVRSGKGALDIEWKAKDLF